jgi:hypothetical protein
MQVEQVKPNKPSFPWVVFWFGTGIIVIFIIAIIVIRTHYRKRQPTPYTNSPAVSRVVQPELRGSPSA